ncbi:amidase [Thioclava sp. GXIMD2076]|uniref:amidase n=1 Tax=Thioclava sp. GXIMD2076 TaxID=3131931 RepID=UPI0030D50BEA
MSRDPLSLMTVTEDVASGSRLIRDIAEDCLDLISLGEPRIGAFSHLSPADIRREADRLDGAPKGPLSGLTVAVKDVIATKDMPTGFANARYEGVRTGWDAPCVDVLRQAGALILGKTVTTEFAATARGGKTRDPRDPARSPGGSSSGSAAAVAAGFCSVAIGTQTGGSTIRPASYCGVWGWKPSWHAISREGLKQFSVTLDTVGFYARHAEDLEALAEVYRLDPAPPVSSLSGLRIGLCRTPVWDRVDAPMREALDEAAKRLRLEGAEVISFELPRSFDTLPATHGKILAREGSTSFLNEAMAQGEALHEQFRTMVATRGGLTAAELRRAYTEADTARAVFDEIMDGFDAVIAPSATGEPPLGQAHTGDAIMNSFWTLLHVPVVSVPGLQSPAGLPLGISFIGQRYTDRRLLNIARLATEVFQADLAFS